MAPAHLLLLSLLVLTAPAAAEEVEGETWVMHFDPATNKPYYAHQETREVRWDAPPGARVVNPEGVEQPRAERPATERRGSDTWNATMNTLLGLGIPVGLLFGGLLFMWYQASQEGLYEVLKTLKLKRDRSQKRKGTKAGSAFRHKFKLSQDGKGGRSANS